MVDWKQVVMHEMFEYYFNFVFLAFFLVAFAWYRRLTLAEFHIKYFGYWGPLIQAAVLAKLIMIGDVMRVGRRFRNRPLVVTTFYRTIVFSVFVGLSTVLEHVVGALFHGERITKALGDIASKGWNELLAASLLVVVAFFPFSPTGSWNARSASSDFARFSCTVLHRKTGKRLTRRGRDIAAALLRRAERAERSWPTRSTIKGLILACGAAALSYQLLELMSTLAITMISAASIFGGALLGMRLQLRLPNHHLSKEMQDLVKLSSGTIATLTALVLGLLVSSAKSSFDAINTGIVQGSAKYILLDRTLARYGSETKAVREQFKHTLAAGIESVWPTEKTGVPALTAFERANGMELVQGKLHELAPQTDAQRQTFAQAQQLAADLSQTRWLLVEEAHTQLPIPLLVILVFWLVLLFMSFGLFAPRNAMAVTVLAVGTCAISAAIFLVLELNRPFDGLIKISSAPLLNALQHLGQ